jgi:tetratricopeptide (TPR) repeat protein
VIQAQLARERPADPWIRSNLAAFHYNIGNLRRDAGTSGAIECYERANEILEPLVRDYRSMVDFRMMYARSLGNLAMLTSSWQTEVRAIPAYTRVADLQREGVELHPGVVRFRLDLATTLFHLARAHIEVDQPRDALRHAREGTETLESVLSTDTDTTGQVRSLLGRTWQKRAEALVALGDEKEAVEALRAAIREQGKAFEPGHRSDDFAALLFEHHYHLVAKPKTRQPASKRWSLCGPTIRQFSSPKSARRRADGTMPPVAKRDERGGPGRLLSYTARCW